MHHKYHLAQVDNKDTVTKREMQEQVPVEATDVNALLSFFSPEQDEVQHKE